MKLLILEFVLVSFILQTVLSSDVIYIKSNVLCIEVWKL